MKNARPLLSRVSFSTNVRRWPLGSSMKVLMRMPSRVHRTTSRSVASTVSRTGGYEKNGSGMPGSKWAVGSPSVTMMICLVPGWRDRSRRLIWKPCCMLVP